MRQCVTVLSDRQKVSVLQNEECFSTPGGSSASRPLGRDPKGGSP